MKNRSFLTDILSVGASKGVVIFSGLIISIITARYIGPEGNGVIAGLTVYPSIFMTIGSLGIRQSTTFFLGNGTFNEHQIKNAITQIWLLSSILSLIISFLLIFYFSSFGAYFDLVLLAVLPIPFTLFNTYNSGIFLGLNDIKGFNNINWIPSVICLVANLVFVAIFPMNVKGALIANISGPLVMCLIYVTKNRFLQYFNFDFNWAIIKKILSLGFIYAIAFLVINLNYKIDIVLLERLSTPFELGVYSKGATITQYLWHIPMLFSTIVFARSASAKDPVLFSQKVAQLLRISILAIASLSLCLMVLSEIVIVGMYGPDFSSSVSVLNYLLPGVLLLTIFKVMNMDLAGKGKPWVSMRAMIPALIINIVLNVILIPKFGADGAAVSSTISYSFAGIIFLFLYSKTTGIPVKQIVRYNRSDFTPIIKIIKSIIK